jgi:hypothetical protein
MPTRRISKHIVECYASCWRQNEEKNGTLYTQTKDTEYIDNLLKAVLNSSHSISTPVPGKQWSRQNYVELGRRLKQDGSRS